MGVYNVDQIDASLLTGRTLELVSVVGISAALKLVELRGGIRLSVPVKPSMQHWLVPYIGFDALKKLIEYYCGEEIEIDRCVKALGAIREQQIIQESAQGLSNSMLARKYGYTERGMRKLRRRVEDIEPSPQRDLFK